MLHDLRLAARLLLKDRRFTFLAVTVLALGIGVNNTQFILVNAICIRGLPVERVDRVVSFGARDARDRDLPLSYREFDEIRAAADAFESVAAFAAAPMVIGDEGRAPDRASGLYVSPNALGLLRARPMLGRDFEPADDRVGAPAVAILGGALWKSRYGGDTAIVGRTIRVDGTPAVVVGVMRDDFRFPANTELWRPLGAMPGITAERRAARALGVFGRMSDGTTLGDTRGRLAALSATMSREHADTNQGIRLTAIPLNERFNGRITDQVWLVFIAVGIVVLLIACANAANLLLMRAAGRGHEMAVRASLGASRGQLIRQLLAESTVLAALGGIVGLGFSLLGVRILQTAIPENTLPYWMTFTMDSRAFAVLCSASMATVFICGLAPAIHVSKTDVGELIKEGRRTGTAGTRTRRWTTVFLTAEFGLSMVLLAALVLSMRLSRHAERAAIVFNPANALTTSITLPPARYRTPDQRSGFYRQLHERLSAIGGVSAAAVATVLPMGGATPRQLAIDGREPAAGDKPPTVWTVTVSPPYFAAIGLHVLRGRAFDDRDGARGAETAIVNQRFVEMFFAGGDAIGHQIRLADASAANVAPPWLTIVGISPTVRQRSLPDPDPVVYLPLGGAPPASANVIVRTASEPAAIGPALREAVRGVDPDVPLHRLMPLEQALTESQWNARVSNMIISGIVLVALGLAAVGLYAVIAHAVVQRTQEIGIRVALGAGTPHLVGIVVRRATAQLALGLAAGVACIVAWERAFPAASVAESGYRLSDPVSLAAVSFVLVAVSAVASVAPAWRAAHLDPVIALRHE
jgi:putative ABC transport system permease protein